MTKNTCPPFGMKSKPITLLAVGLLWAGFAQSQESANASGGDATGSVGRVAYSIRQAVHTNNSVSNGSAAQGAQHTFEIFTVDIKETELNISLTAFPKPTTKNLTMQMSDYNNEKLS